MTLAGWMIGSLAGSVACGARTELGVIDESWNDAGVTADSSLADTATPHDAAHGFTPRSLNNLVLWLDASQLVKLAPNGEVMAWGDLSSFQNDAQAATGFAPTLLQNGINDLSSIHFGASNSPLSLTINDSTSLEWGTDDFVLAVVARFTNDPQANSAANFYSKSTFLGQAGSGVEFWGNVCDLTNTITDGLLMRENYSTGVTAHVAYHDGVARAFLVRRAAGMMELRVNGASVATQSEWGPVDVSAPWTSVLIGADWGHYYPIFGDIAEIVGLKGPTSIGDLSALEAYLTAKYAL